MTIVARLGTTGMTCPACPIIVREALTRVSDVGKTLVDYSTESVACGVEGTSVAALLKATANASYPTKSNKQVEQIVQKVKS